MKTYDETIRAVFDGRDKILKEQQQKKKMLKRTLIPLVCGFAVILLGVGIWRSGVLQKTPSMLPTEPSVQTTLPAISQDETTGEPSPMTEQTPESVPSSVAEITEVPASQGYSVPIPSESATDTSSTTVPAVQPGTSDVPDGENFGGPSGGETGYFNVPVLPQLLLILWLLCRMSVVGSWLVKVSVGMISVVGILLLLLLQSRRISPFTIVVIPIQTSLIMVAT